MNEAQEILTEAADILEAAGWTQGTSQNERGQFCTLGAINEATWTLGYYNSAQAGDALRSYLGDPSLSIVAWNDTPGRNRKEVVAALRGAAGRVDS